MSKALLCAHAFARQSRVARACSSFGIVVLVAMIECATLQAQGTPDGDDLVIDFGTVFGTWNLYDGDNVSGYELLHPGSPESVVTGDLDNNGVDEVILDFGAAGIWVRENNLTWSQLHPTNPSRMVTGDLDGNGQDEIIIDFPGFGIWVRKNNATWELLHPFNSNFITVGHLDSGTAADLIIDFPVFGIWINYNNDPLNWNNIHALNSQRMAVGDFDGNGQDDIVINFTGFGLWNFANNGTWSQVHTSNAIRLIAGNLDSDVTGRDELIVDFGAPGIWILPNGGAGAWTDLHPGPSQEFAIGDLDANGDDDLVVDFGAAGLWVYANNSTWVQLHTANPEGLAVGDINPPGILTGTVSDASNGLPISGAIVAVGTLQATTNASGVYTIPNAPSGARTVTTSAAGFSTRADTVVITAFATTTFSTSLAQPGILTGTVSDASTGLPISGAIVAVGTVQATTNASGVYTLPDVPSGTRTVTTNAAGFSTRYDTVVVAAGATTTFSTSLVPGTASGNLTIVLNWGTAPADLDSHLTGPNTSGGRFHVYWADRNPVPYASLDVDDTTSFGPETVTVSTLSGNFIPGSYSYFVHNYSTTPEFNVSGASVTVFQGGVQLAQFLVSDAIGSPALDIWSVFSFTLTATPTGGIVITPIQRFEASAPSIVLGEVKR